MIRALIFDLDGTLVDTLGDIALVMNGLLERHGWPRHETDEYRSMVGKGLARLVDAAVPGGIAHDYPALYREALEAYETLGSGDSRPYPGVRETLDLLAARGVPMSIVSNKPDSVTRSVVAQLFPAVRFALVRGGLDGEPAKPHPAGALAAGASMGAPPEECAFVGDSDVDMQTALAAGMYPIGALWGFRSEAELSAAGARAIARSIRDVPAICGLA